MSAQGSYNSSQHKQAILTPLTEENYVDLAMKAINSLRVDKKTGKPAKMLTTSQIRNLLAMTSDIYNDVQNEKKEQLDKDIIARINYLRVRFVYEAGREKKVKAFVQETHILDYLVTAKKGRKEYILFSRYMEALVAYHRYYGGKDQ